MSIRKAATLAAANTALSMLVSFLSIKVTAVYLGASGVACLGQLTQFMTLVHGTVSNAVHTGLVHRTASANDSKEETQKAAAAGAAILFSLGVPVALLIATFSEELSTFLFHTTEYRAALLLLPIPYLAGLAASVYLAMASGARDYKSTTLINSTISVASLLLTCCLTIYVGLLGAMCGLAILPALTFLASIYYSRNKSWRPKFPHPNFSFQEIRRLLNFFPMSLVNIAGGPLLQLAIRDGVAQHGGLHSVGILQGVTRLSDIIMSVANSLFLMYFFPRFGELKTRLELQPELIRGFFLVTLITASASTAIYFLRDFVISMIFTKDFLEMRDLFLYQMTGNTLRIGGSIFGYFLLAKVHPYWMAAIDISTHGIWWLLSYTLIPDTGAIGATQAYAGVWLLYCLTVPVIAWGVLRRTA